MFASILDDPVAQSQLPCQNAASPVITGTDTSLAHTNPRHIALDAGSSQAHQADIIEPGTIAGSGLHQFYTEHYYVSQDVPAPLTFPDLPTELLDDFWGSTLDDLQNPQVNIIILHQIFAIHPQRVLTFASVVHQRPSSAHLGQPTRGLSAHLGKTIHDLRQATYPCR